MPFDDKVASLVLGKCGRRCCICRRFLPLRLQVHHIQEECGGGTNTEDNAIAICLTCHTDVHSKVPFTRRFTTAELRHHRDEVYRLVAEGKLIPPHDEGLSPAVNINVRSSGVAGYRLTPTAAELLVRLAYAGGSLDYGCADGGYYLSPSGGENWLGDQQHRTRVLYEDALGQLVRQAFAKQFRWPLGGDTIYELTHMGYLAADEIAAKTGVAKAKSACGDAPLKVGHGWVGLAEPAS